MHRDAVGVNCKVVGFALGSGLPYILWAKGHTRGIALAKFHSKLPARHSGASHLAAEP